MLGRMKLFLVVAVVSVVGCGAIQNADREVNKKTDHGSSHGGGPVVDGGPSPTTGADGGSKDSGVTSM